MTDTQKIVEEQINQAWARGTNWAMQGRGYALDSNADTQAEVLIELFRNIQEEARAEERARILAVIRKRCRLPIGDVVEFIDELEDLTKKG